MICADHMQYRQQEWLRFSVWLVFPGLGVEGEFLRLEVEGERGGYNRKRNFGEKVNMPETDCL